MKRFLVIVLIGLLLGGCGLTAQRTPDVWPTNLTSFPDKLDDSLEKSFPQKPKYPNPNEDTDSSFL